MDEPLTKLYTAFYAVRTTTNGLWPILAVLKLNFKNLKVRRSSLLALLILQERSSLKFCFPNIK